MRGRGGRGMPRRGGFGARRHFQPHVPFDMAHCETAFPRVAGDLEDKPLTEALLKRNTDLSPNSTEQTAISSLVSKLQAVIDALIVAPNSFESAIIEESRPIGSYKKGTMVTGRNCADLAVILRTLPTREAVTALGKRLIDNLRAQNPKEPFALIAHDRGFDIKIGEASVRCLITTIPPNINKLEPELHLPVKMMAQHLAAIRHVRWFEENASHSSIKVLVRLLKDLKNRYSGLSCLSPWIIDLLAHHAIMSNPNRVPLPINIAFRRVLSLLASGIFLPGSIGILDPCEIGNGRVHVNIPLEQMDMLCMTGQTMCRVLAHGGYKQLLELEGAVDVMANGVMRGDVMVTPARPIYQKITDCSANGNGFEGNAESLETAQGTVY